MRHKFHGQMSESFWTAAFLSVSGGLQDAYTYLFRGKVFANAQTGNIVLLSQSLAARDWGLAVHYLIPLVSFAKYRMAQRIHWRQVILLVEILLLLVVGFIPENMNILANAMVSFSCAMQVQAFRKVNGYAFASTMCIGNIRSCMESLCAYRKTRDGKTLHKSFCYLGIILMFALGAGIGGSLIALFSSRTIWFSCVLLLISFLFMFIKEELEEHFPMET